VSTKEMFVQDDHSKACTGTLKIKISVNTVSYYTLIL